MLTLLFTFKRIWRVSSSLIIRSRLRKDSRLSILCVGLLGTPKKVLLSLFLQRKLVYTFWFIRFFLFWVQFLRGKTKRRADQSKAKRRQGVLKRDPHKFELKRLPHAPAKRPSKYGFRKDGRTQKSARKFFHQGNKLPLFDFVRDLIDPATDYAFQARSTQSRVSRKNVPLYKLNRRRLLVDKAPRKKGVKHAGTEAVMNATKRTFFLFAGVKIHKNFQASSVATWRHVEVNSGITAAIILPMPSLHFYSFVLDHSYLWRQLLMEYFSYLRQS